MYSTPSVAPTNTLIFGPERLPFLHCLIGRPGPVLVVRITDARTVMLISNLIFEDGDKYWMYAFPSFRTAMKPGVLALTGASTGAAAILNTKSLLYRRYRIWQEQGGDEIK